MSAHCETSIRLVLADDHPLFLDGARSLVSLDAGIIVVGEATNGARALQLIGEARPDVAVLDMTMPEMSGLSLLRRLRSTDAKTRVIILSAHDDRSVARDALEAGARGYVLKRSAREHLLQAIRSVSDGGLYLDPGVAERVLPTRGLAARTSDKGASEALGCLTAREREVVRLIAFGFTNKEVAGKLGVTTKSVETYRSRAGNKLNLRSRTKIVQYALRQGWLQDCVA